MEIIIGSCQEGREQSYIHVHSNWVDFVKSGCEKSWAEVQADSFSFECRRMYEDEGTRGGVGRAEAARCGNGGKGTGGVVLVVPVGEQ